MVDQVVTSGDIARAVEMAGMADRPVCVHSSLRSFGHLPAGAATVIDAVLAAGATLVVPASTFRSCMAAPPPGATRPYNSQDDGSLPRPGHVPAAAWDRAATFIDPAMGALPAA